MNRFNLAYYLFLGILISMGTSLSAKTVNEELDAAKKTRKTVFLVVTGNGVKADFSMKIAQQAAKQLKESIVLSLNRDDKSNSEIVTKMALASVPIPMIMVVGMNGLPAGGLQEKEATSDKLVKLAPSPKKAEALGYLNEKKPVFVIGYKKSFADRTKVIEKVKEAIILMKGNAAFVEVDMDDLSEKPMLYMIGANLKSQKTVTVVANAQGKITGNFNGIPDVDKLVTAAKTQPKSCCPPGSGKTCGK